MNSIAELINKIGQKAKLASVTLRIANTEQKNSSLDCIANQIQENKQLIIDANNIDMHVAKKNNIDDALLDRLMLDDERLDAVVESLKQIVNLDDPIGKTSEFVERPSGIKIGKKMVPLGVIGMIYESRPNVTVDAALQGDTERVNKIFNSLVDDSIPPVILISSRYREIKNLATMSIELKTNDSIDFILNKHRVWQKRKPLISTALKKHSYQKLQKLLLNLGRIDSSLKGMDNLNVYDELQNVVISLSGKNNELNN